MKMLVAVLVWDRHVDHPDHRDRAESSLLSRLPRPDLASEALVSGLIIRYSGTPYYYEYDA